MELQQYINNKVKIYNCILEYIEGDNDFKLDLNILKNEPDLIETMYIISNISKNHHRCTNFNVKIKRILDYFLNQIKQMLTISEIYDIFKENKIILAYLFEKGVLTPDKSLLDYLKIYNVKTQNLPKSSYYFYPELKSIYSNLGKIIEDDLNKENPEILKNFNEKRLIGENDSYICSLIRNDSIEEFVKYVTQTSYSLSSTVNYSIFETNPFLIDRPDTNLIEYAAFYGSIQIYQFLKFNQVKFSPRLWFYAIHGNNPILIHQLEEDGIQLTKFYEQCDLLCEAIKCHHNDLVDYIRDNVITEKYEKVEESGCFYNDVNSFIFRSFNFHFFPNQMSNEILYLFYGSYFNYLSLVELLINTGKYNVNQLFILNHCYFK